MAIVSLRVSRSWRPNIIVWAQECTFTLCLLSSDAPPIAPAEAAALHGQCNYIDRYKINGHCMENQNCSPAVEADENLRRCYETTAAAEATLLISWLNLLDEHPKTIDARNNDIN